MKQFNANLYRTHKTREISYVMRDSPHSLYCGVEAYELRRDDSYSINSKIRLYYI